MKVLHVIPSVSAVHGGPSIAIRTMTTALARSGLEAHIATTDDDGHGWLQVPLAQPVVEAGVTTWYFHRQSSFYKFSWPLTRWLAAHAAGYDLLHIHALFSYAALPACAAAARHSVPYILRPLGTLNRWGMQHQHRRLKRLSFPLLERRLIAHAGLMHYTSEAEYEEARALGVERPHAVIPLGIDLPDSPSEHSQRWLAQHAPHLTGRLMVLFLSRIDPKKGLDLLLPAFAQLKAQRPDAGLLIAGAGEPAYVASLQRQADALGIAPDLCWAGHLSGADKQGAFSAADVFALPSYSENFGIAVVEAMAAGLPVVISDQVGIHREVTAAGAGYAVPCNAEAIGDALAALLDNPAARQAMGTSARLLAANAYSVQAMTTKLIEAYSQLAAATRAARPETAR